MLFLLRQHGDDDEVLIQEKVYLDFSVFFSKSLYLDFLVFYFTSSVFCRDTENEPENNGFKKSVTFLHQLNPYSVFHDQLVK